MSAGNETVLEKVSYDVQKVRNNFPVLKRQIHGHPLAYLDTANSAQKPTVVLDAMSQCFTHSYANIHRGIHTLSCEMTDTVEAARKKVQTFINAPQENSIVFTKGATEAINLIAHTFGRSRLSQDDVIIISEMEHHANIVPWQMLRDEVGIKLKIIPIHDDGSLDLEAYQKLLNNKVKLVSITHMSNVLGTINPVEEITRMAHQHKIPVLVDGCQAIAHMPVDVQKLDCDFYTFSSHKLYGPTGLGILYGKYDLLEQLPPYQTGGNVIARVSFEKTTFKAPPDRFEAGTLPIIEIVGLTAAIDYINTLGIDNIIAHEDQLLAYAQDRLTQEIPGLHVIGTAKNKAGIISFSLGEIHAHDVSTFADSYGVAVRAGHHCAQPLMARYGVTATTRASLGLYNSRKDIDQLVDALHNTLEFF